MAITLTCIVGLWQAILDHDSVKFGRFPPIFKRIRQLFLNSEMKGKMVTHCPIYHNPDGACGEDNRKTLFRLKNKVDPLAVALFVILIGATPWTTTSPRNTWQNGNSSRWLDAFSYNIRQRQRENWSNVHQLRTIYNGEHSICCFLFITAAQKVPSCQKKCFEVFSEGVLFARKCSPMGGFADNTIILWKISPSPPNLQSVPHATASCSLLVERQISWCFHWYPPASIYRFMLTSEVMARKSIASFHSYSNTCPVERSYRSTYQDLLSNMKAQSSIWH